MAISQLYINKTTRKKIVLDLDHCLIRSFLEMDTYYTLIQDPKYVSLRGNVRRITLGPSPHNGYTTSSDIWYIKRPYLDTFLDYIQDNYDISIWSAGKDFYVSAIVDDLFKDRQRKPEIVMTWNDVDKRQNPLYTKPLSKFYTLDPSANPSNTVLIDDTIENFVDNQENGVLVLRFSPTDLNDILGWTSDTELLRILGLLQSNEFIYSNDVRTMHPYTDLYLARRSPWTRPFQYVA